MNDAQWLRLWCARHVRATSGDVRGKAEELARKAEAAAARDGFSVDAALREGSRIAYQLYSKRAAPACRLQAKRTAMRRLARAAPEEVRAAQPSPNSGRSPAASRTV